MEKPSRFLLVWEEPYWVQQDIWVHDLQAARAQAIHKSTRLGGGTVIVYERVDFYQQLFSPEFPDLLCWEWEDEINRGDATNGKWQEWE